MTEKDYLEMKQILKEQRELVSRDAEAARELLIRLNIFHLCIPQDAYTEMEVVYPVDTFSEGIYVETKLRTFLCN
ncbi:hypothetical protein MRBLMN1_000708 [Chitinophaga ginsengisegetis]|uniref:hypothetical protein n=1 Tax=Chitinophaga ginsengisegetis TaxID=393003 RepID=UPI0034385DF3